MKSMVPLQDKVEEDKNSEKDETSDGGGGEGEGGMKAVGEKGRGVSVGEEYERERNTEERDRDQNREEIHVGCVLPLVMADILRPTLSRLPPVKRPPGTHAALSKIIAEKKNEKRCHYGNSFLPS